jgi:hypothetical protein
MDLDPVAARETFHEIVQGGTLRSSQRLRAAALPEGRPDIGRWYRTCCAVWRFQRHEYSAAPMSVGVRHLLHQLAYAQAEPANI